MEIHNFFSYDIISNFEDTYCKSRVQLPSYLLVKNDQYYIIFQIRCTSALFVATDFFLWSHVSSQRWTSDLKCHISPGNQTGVDFSSQSSWIFNRYFIETIWVSQNWMSFLTPSDRSQFSEFQGFIGYPHHCSQFLFSVLRKIILCTIFQKFAESPQSRTNVFLPPFNENKVN